ncbi:LysR family transcriptional regulator [Rhodococcus ruber]|uniref:LysR family transcriptional regulator n=1 Tax=Rhodococcus ruber TaxID=1830 RepID=A0ABT4MEB7_9NOCA|nr:LysR family transcriptional regulator [Rhodococcus ruber]MCZ4519328.1 LysR family transcriptional regulator [Rhodococcus ruber]
MLAPVYTERLNLCLAAGDIEIRHLSMFHAVAQSRSFTRAAELLHITQPALSRSIAQLERRLGVRLLDRTTHGVQLTPSGIEFLPFCRNALLSFNEAIASIRGDATLRVGFTWSAALELTPLIIREFERLHPGVEVEPRKCDDSYAGVLDGRTHIAFLRGTQTHAALESIVLFEERRVAALHPTHPLATRLTLCLDDIRSDPLVVNTVSGVTTPDLWPDSVQTRATVRTHNLEEWLEAIALGRGIGVTAESTSRLYVHPGIKYIPLMDAETIPVAVAWPSARPHPLAKAFAQTSVRLARSRKTDRNSELSAPATALPCNPA